MPATSRSGELLARRSSAGRDGSPSKSTIITSFCDDQHLAEMIVAVDARLDRRRPGSRASASISAEALAPARRAALDRGRARSGVARPRALERREGALGLAPARPRATARDVGRASAARPRRPGRRSASRRRGAARPCAGRGSRA